MDIEEIKGAQYDPIIPDYSTDQRSGKYEHIPRPLKKVDDQESMRKIVYEYIDFLSCNVITHAKTNNFLMAMRKKYHVECGYANILWTYRTMVDDNLLEYSDDIVKYMMARNCRSHSGVIVITIMTSAYPRTGKRTVKFSCKYDCHYCPNEPAREENNWVDQPRSYLYDEPAVRRANQNGFDPVAHSLSVSFEQVASGTGLCSF